MELLIPLAKIVVVLVVLLTSVAYTVLLERRVAAAIQNRIGPNRVGWNGLLQPLADVVKLVMKEDIVPRSANRFIHDLAPMISIAIALVAFAVGAWLSASLDGTVTPLAATMMVLGLCTATCAWTLVRRHGQPSARPA
ncbi:NADH-quinone oxidoreductase subunit H, partial [Roseateles sp.]|uniref:NADH-quinone oxidoreductase subunit H n=1 Tax=Roseateles sp. TaxID=1971397 RepID=UPI002F3F398D